MDVNRDICISEYLALFIKTKNFKYLIRAVVLSFAQKRILEIAWSVYCLLRHRPLEVHQSSALSSVRCDAIELLRLQYFDGLYFNRDNILKRYAQRYSVHSIPHDFGGARLEAIIEVKGLLVLGEYAENSARLLCIDATKCIVNNLYCDAPHVRHIHAIHMSEVERCIFVTTGDGSKFLDKWVVNSGELVFTARIRKHLAGHTAAITANGKDYFGTDFSSRPNYLERLDRKRFFFPSVAYKMIVLHMSLLNERYIVCLSGEHRGERCAVSIFDSMREIFIYCDYFEPLPVSMAEQATIGASLAAISAGL